MHGVITRTVVHQTGLQEYNMVVITNLESGHTATLHITFHILSVNMGY